MASVEGGTREELIPTSRPENTKAYIITRVTLVQYYGPIVIICTTTRSPYRHGDTLMGGTLPAVLENNTVQML